MRRIIEKSGPFFTAIATGFFIQSISNFVDVKVQ